MGGIGWVTLLDSGTVIRDLYREERVGKMLFRMPEKNKNLVQGHPHHRRKMDWAGIEPAASSMPRKRSTTDLPARSYLLGCHRLKELFRERLPEGFARHLSYSLIRCPGTRVRRPLAGGSYFCFTEWLTAIFPKIVRAARVLGTPFTTEHDRIPCNTIFPVL